MLTNGVIDFVEIGYTALSPKLVKQRRLSAMLIQNRAHFTSAIKDMQRLNSFTDVAELRYGTHEFVFHYSCSVF
jgi:hypothetical protein